MSSSDDGKRRRPVFIGAQHFTDGKGGIAGVARLTAKVVKRMGRDVRLLSLLDTNDGSIDGSNWRSTRGSRIGYAAGCHLASLQCDGFVYDSVGMARAHPRVAPMRRPYAVWIHGIEVWHSLNEDRARALRGASLVLVNSMATLEKFHELHSDLSLESAKICWLGTEDDEAPASVPKQDGPPVVLVIGTTDLGSFYKGHSELVACWHKVVASVPEARLVMVGGGNGVDYLRSLVAASPAAANIVVKGFVPQDSISLLWRSASILALPSRKEGFGLVYIEAMRHSLPVIASVHDAGREVNVDGRTGYNVNLDRPDELAERLISLLKSPDLARQMGVNGHERWLEHFRFSAFERRLRSILNPFLANKL